MGTIRTMLYMLEKRDKVSVSKDFPIWNNFQQLSDFAWLNVLQWETSCWGTLLFISRGFFSLVLFKIFFIFWYSHIIATFPPLLSSFQNSPCIPPCCLSYSWPPFKIVDIYVYRFNIYEYKCICKCVYTCTHQKTFIHTHTHTRRLL